MHRVLVLQVTRSVELARIVLLCCCVVVLLGYGALRIFGGGDSGRLEFQLANGTWGTICDKGFDNDAGKVACRQLGYRRSSDVLVDNSECSVDVIVSLPSLNKPCS